MSLARPDRSLELSVSVDSGARHSLCSPSLRCGFPHEQVLEL